MKKRYIILLVICLVCIAICLALNAWYQSMLRDSGQELESKRDQIKEFVSPSPSDAETDPPKTDPPDADETDTTAPDTSDPSDTSETVSPDTESADTSAAETDAPVESGEPNLNFDKLWQTNEEIIAWLEIKDTYIDYPVLQSKDNDKKYLNRAYDGSWYIGGALFTEATYNRADFNDPVTVIYGHTMPWSILFGSLQENYSDSRSFARNSDIKLYLPDEVRHYTVFAAVPYSKMHILHTYDFTDRYRYNGFFKDVGRTREIGANFNRDAFPQWGDRVLILSVCLNEDTTRRFLVMAVLNEDLADNIDTTSK